MKQEMAKLQGMLEAVLKPSAGVAGSSGSRAASSPQRAALRPASSKHEGVSTGPGADRGVEARVTQGGEERVVFCDPPGSFLDNCLFSFTASHCVGVSVPRGGRAWGSCCACKE